MGYEYAGIAYEEQGEMLAARRRHYVELVLAGMGYAEAARAVGVSKRTDLCQDFGHGSLRDYAATGRPSSAGLVRSKNDSGLATPTWTIRENQTCFPELDRGHVA